MRIDASTAKSRLAGFLSPPSIIAALGVGVVIVAE